MSRVHVAGLDVWVGCRIYNCWLEEIIVIEYAALSIIGNPLEYWRL